MIVNTTYSLEMGRQGRIHITSKPLFGVIYIGYIIPEECLGIFGFYAFLNAVASHLNEANDSLPIDVLGSVWELKPYATGVAHT